jgi:hypothetical protein
VNVLADVADEELHTVCTGLKSISAQFIAIFSIASQASEVGSVAGWRGNVFRILLHEPVSIEAAIRKRPYSSFKRGHGYTPSPLQSVNPVSRSSLDGDRGTSAMAARTSSAKMRRSYLPISFGHQGCSSNNVHSRQRQLIVYLHDSISLLE